MTASSRLIFPVGHRRGIKSGNPFQTIQSNRLQIRERLEEVLVLLSLAPLRDEK